MIRIKKLGLILEETVFIDSILKNGMVIRVPCQFVNADYDRLFLKFPADKTNYAQYFYEGKIINVTLDTIDGRRIYPALILYEPHDGLFVVEYYNNETMVQKRKHFRVKASKLVDVELNDIIVHGVTIDISSGGFRLLLGDELKEGNIYRATFALNADDNPISLTFKVCSLYFVSSEHQYEISAEFVDVAEQDQKQITKFCFDIQTKFINKIN